MMLRLVAAFIITFYVATVAAAQNPPHSPTLERVRRDGVLHCGSAIRPGLAFPAVDHSWHGLQVDLCHALAAAIGVDRVEYSGYALRPDFDRIRDATDDVAFLTTSELFTNELFAAILPGPPVFQQTTRIMVWDSLKLRDVGDLHATMVCAEPGTGAERGLRAHAARTGWQLNFSGWMELEEMMDAFNVGRCPAVAGEATALAALRLGSAQAGHPARILDLPLAVTPVLAATPAADPAWANIVTWTIATVMDQAGGAEVLPLSGGWLGLDAGWQARVRGLGSYAQIYDRNLGAGSALDLAPGVNAPWRSGGLLVAPAVE